VREQLAGFVADVVDRLEHPRQREHAETYVRGLIEQGPRKSLQPTLFRLGECGLDGVDAGYQSVQQFLADSPWDPQVVLRATAERVAPRLEVAAWVVDDTGFPKDGKCSPGVKRQYSGTLGKVGNCQIGVSVHAVGAAGTLPLGWALYLPVEWCDDAARRRRAKVPDDVVFQTKAQLAAGLVATARSWDVPTAPILADQAYGDDSVFRETLDGQGASYVVAVGQTTTVFGPTTLFQVPERGPAGRPPSVAQPDRAAQRVEAIARALPQSAWQTVPCRTRPDARVETSRFALLRVWAAYRILRHRHAPRPEWLIIELG
jgi:SRSO17 transposase